LVAELERDHPIVGWIEDPLVKNDLHGWRMLRQQTRIPLIMHGTPMGGMQELLHDLADVYMIGGPIGDLLATGFAFGKANVQVILQYEAGTLGKAMAMHMAAVLPTHTAHSINTDDQYAEDITTETIPVVEGSSPVPDGPGLGYEVDESALHRVAAQKPVEIPRHVGILRLPGGTAYYGKGHINPATVTGREEGTVRGVSSEIWEDDGSGKFEEVYDRVQRQGTVRVD
ncbi:enolase C-terminal domain-like protein, partial [Candidatus Latescibacterota bacterium]